MTKPASDSGSDGRPAALFLSPEAPYPMAGGGALRSASLVEYLARHYAVDVIVFREPGAPDPGHAFPAGVARRVVAIELPYHSKRFAARVTRTAWRLARGVPPLVDRFSGFGGQFAAFLGGRRYELGIIEHFWCAPYVEQLAPVCARTVLDLHNVESVLYTRCAHVTGGLESLAYGMLSRASGALERRWLSRFTTLLAVSEQDAAAVRAIAPESRVSVYSNALPPVECPRVERECAIVFSGNLEYLPNVTGVRWFRQAVWPGLRERWPELRWRLVGRNPQAVARYAAGDPRIECTGPPADALAEIARASVAVVPVLAGSGTRFKIIEAWAAGVPVVSTSIGAEGLPARDGENILLADDAASFGAAVDRLLADGLLREKIGCTARDVFERQLTWRTAWSQLEI